MTDHEESSIDTSFIALALHNYKSQAVTPVALRDSINALENRFNFAAFSGPGAYKQAYFQPTGLFGCCTYSGYTNENKVIALAAALSTDHNVSLASMWNKDTGRVLASLVDPNENHLVYSFGTEYRAPFVQACLAEPVRRSTVKRERGGRQQPHRPRFLVDGGESQVCEQPQLATGLGRRPGRVGWPAQVLVERRAGCGAHGGEQRSGASVNRVVVLENIAGKA